jgi:hypothetical protein
MQGLSLLGKVGRTTKHGSVVLSVWSVWFQIPLSNNGVLFRVQAYVGLGQL